jgi:hypothetical protein
VSKKINIFKSLTGDREIQKRKDGRGLKGIYFEKK